MKDSKEKQWRLTIEPLTESEGLYGITCDSCNKFVEDWSLTGTLCQEHYKGIKGKTIWKSKNLKTN